MAAAARSLEQRAAIRRGRACRPRQDADERESKECDRDREATNEKLLLLCYDFR
jgi:hypothetical protein